MIANTAIAAVRERNPTRETKFTRSCKVKVASEPNEN